MLLSGMQQQLHWVSLLITIPSVENQVIKLFRQIVRAANVRGAEEADYTFITLLIDDLAQLKDREAFKENDAPVQKYAGYLYNLHLSKCQEAKNEWSGTTKGLYLRTWFGYTTKMWR